jgi:ABC-type transport system involved in multi-copper enzyme maturation permease subunit
LKGKRVTEPVENMTAETPTPEPEAPESPPGEPAPRKASAGVNYRAILRVASATFFEARRRRYLNVILVFALILIALASLFSTLTPNAELNMLLDIGLGSIRLCGMLIAVFLGARLIADEIDKNTIDVILAKPVRRSEFVIGKFLGGWLTVVVNLALMGVAFMIVYAIKAPQLVDKAIGQGQFLSLKETSVNCSKAIGLIFFEMMVLTSIAIAVSTVTSWIFSSVFALTVYFAGQLGSYFQHLAEFRDPHAGAAVVTPTVKVFAWIVYRILPHFEHFDIREKILTHDPVYWGMVGATAGHAVLYSFVMVALACVFFSNREF